MRMFINTVLVLRAVNGQWQMAENNHLLANDLAIHGMGTELYSNAVTLRPQDIFGTLLFENQYGDDGSALYDFRPSLANGITKSSRGNSIHGNYLAKSLNAIHGAQTSSEYQTSTTGSIYSEALSRVKENNIADDPLLQRMDDETGLFEEGYFTYGWLCKYSPSVNARGVTRSILLDQPTRTNTDYVHQSNNFKGSTVESVMATILTNTVPTTLMECFLTKIHFITTNMTMDNSVSVQLVDLPQGFVDGGLVEKFANMFIDKLIHIIMPDVTNNFQHLVNVDMSVDVLGDTKINISINGGAPEPFVVPSFADGLMAPIIGNDTSDVRNLALDITTLAGNLEKVPTSVIVPSHTSPGYNW